MNFKETIIEYKKSYPEEPRVSGIDMISNFIPLGDRSKIYALDTILDITKSVFGPYGGLYAKFSKATQSDDSSVIKSKDGNGFFRELLLYPDFANTILHLMRQKTDYIANLKTDTSKDGTTSLTMISSAVSKLLLTNRILGKFDFPSTVYNIMFDTVLSEGSKIIDKYKSLVYDDKTNTFINDGETTILNAINTTVNNNPIFYNAYKDLIEQAKKSNSNILDMQFEKAPLFREDEPGLELKLYEGISAVIKDLNKMNSKSYIANNQLLIIFDGFVELNFISDIYLRMLYSFLHKRVFELAEMTGAEGVVCIFNRTPENLINLLKADNEAGYITCPKTANIDSRFHGRTLKFRACVFDDTNIGRERFEDILEIFSDSVIDLTYFNDYVKNYLAKNYLTKVDKIVNVDSTTQDMDIANIQRSFGSKESINKFINLNENYKPLESLFGFSNETLERMNSRGKFEYEPRKMLVDVKFNGYDMNILFKDNETAEKARDKYKKLKEVFDSIESINVNTDELEYRMRCLTSYRLQPIIYARTPDEREELMALLLDSQGVFISTMVHGVHGGGNTLIIKHQDELMENSIKTFRDSLTGKLSETKLDNYTEGLKVLVNSIVEGYKLVYKFILKYESDEEFDAIIADYMTKYKDDTRITYNVITGLYSDKIIEAAKTTMDVFSCGLSVAKDILLIQNCSNNYKSVAEYGSIASFNTKPILHSINDFLINTKEEK